ncbi:WD40-repeat-containing domain protein [Lentinula edodes]|nr:WD40-repeat-containing domain protein [Lentinula edodes]
MSVTARFMSNNADIGLPNPPNDSISSFSFSNKADYLAVGSWDNSVRVYEVSPQGQSKGIAVYTHLAPENSRIFSGSVDNTGLMFDLVTGQTTQVAQHAGPVKIVKWYWDVRAPSPIATVKLPERCYALDARYPLMVAATAERRILTFDLAQSPILYENTASPQRLQTRVVTCCPDKIGFAVGGIEGRVSFCYLEENNKRSKKNDQSLIYSINDINFHPVHGTFSTCGSDGTVHFWDRDARMRLKSFNRASGPIVCSAFNRTGSIFAYAVSYDWHKGFSGMTSKQPNKIMVHVVKDEDVRKRATRSTYLLLETDLHLEMNNQIISPNPIYGRIFEAENIALSKTPSNFQVYGGIREVYGFYLHILKDLLLNLSSSKETSSSLHNLPDSLHALDSHLDSLRDRQALLLHQLEQVNADISMAETKRARINNDNVLISKLPPELLSHIFLSCQKEFHAFQIIASQHPKACLLLREYLESLQASQLDFLAIHVDWADSGPYDRIMSNVPLILKGGAPSLTSLQLTGIASGLRPPISSGITTLHLDGVYMLDLTVFDYRNILAATPSLVNLSLRGLKIDQPAAGMKELQTLELPQLRSLRFRAKDTDHPFTYNNPLLTALPLNQLENLVLCDMDKLWLFDFPNVRDLSLYECNFGISDIGQLMLAFPSVASLTLESASLLYMALSIEGKPVWWPNLRTLRVRDLAINDVPILLRMVQRRTQMDHPVEVVGFDITSRRRASSILGTLEVWTKIYRIGDYPEPWPPGVNVDVIEDDRFWEIY